MKTYKIYELKLKFIIYIYINKKLNKSRGIGMYKRLVYLSGRRDAVIIPK